MLLVSFFRDVWIVDWLKGDEVLKGEWLAKLREIGG
jgi:hypothetical protein